MSAAGCVLIAEDNVAMGYVIRFGLERAGLEAVHVVSGDKAWDLLQHRHFDMLVTDFQMPGMTGGELCQRMRQDQRWVDTPVILLTAKAFEIETAYYRQTLGVSAVLMKPFSPRELTRLVQETLAVEASSHRSG
jgi:CheY-like chemotaxis protein